MMRWLLDVLRKIGIAPERVLVAILERQFHIEKYDMAEHVTILFYETRGGSRSFKVYQYGECLRVNAAARLLGPVHAWVDGGPLPPGAVLNPEAPLKP